jgi:hypothetical protein
VRVAPTPTITIVRIENGTASHDSSLRAWAPQRLLKQWSAGRISQDAPSLPGDCARIGRVRHPNQAAQDRSKRDRARAILLSVAWLLACSCSAADPQSESLRTPARCTGKGHFSQPPRSIEDVVALANELPKPLDLACFVQALARPLRLRAVYSVFSAQPAVGYRSPRFFIFSEPLIMTVVPEGIGSNLLELSELQPDPTLSLKGELVFPLEDDIGSGLPYTTIEAEGGGGTRCAACHRHETRAASVTSAAAYISAAYEARSEDSSVSLIDVESEARNCDVAVEPERCEILQALFSGPVETASFPSGMLSCLSD